MMITISIAMRTSLSRQAGRLNLWSCTVVAAVMVSVGACGQSEPAPAPANSQLAPQHTSSQENAAGKGSTSSQTQTVSASIPTIRLSPAFPNITFQRPVCITHAPDESNRLFVVEQPGRISVLENRTDVEKTSVFLDIRSKVRARHNEEGLLSLVFHPQFRENGWFYVYYSVSDPKRNRISRFSIMSDDPNRADPESETIILEVEQKYGNHNGSTLLFGPDGYLYASFGDGGFANDPDGHGQNLATLLGSIIRIDVNRQEDAKAYAIPSDNPFVGREGVRPEIWAYGLRNVWRMSFDRVTGDLWAGDVGQDAWEEIDLIVKGGNYGWNLREGAHPFGRNTAQRGAGGEPLIDPVIDYSHREGISVTGGYVYRGKSEPRLQGVYIYADYGSRAVWGLRHENGTVTVSRQILSGADSAFITSFGEDKDGELYACAFDRMDGGRGRIFRVVAN